MFKYLATLTTIIIILITLSMINYHHSVNETNTTCPNCQTIHHSTAHFCNACREIAIQIIENSLPGNERFKQALEIEEILKYYPW